MTKQSKIAPQSTCICRKFGSLSALACRKQHVKQACKNKNILDSSRIQSKKITVALSETFGFYSEKRLCEEPRDTRSYTKRVVKREKGSEVIDARAFLFALNVPLWQVRRRHDNSRQTNAGAFEPFKPLIYLRKLAVKNGRFNFVR